MLGATISRIARVRTHLRKPKISDCGNILIFDKGVGLDPENDLFQRFLSLGPSDFRVDRYYPALPKPGATRC